LARGKKLKDAVIDNFATSCISFAGTAIGAALLGPAWGALLVGLFLNILYSWRK
jgi:Mn2+/Fe2+ NRAMP family transporter